MAQHDKTVDGLTEVLCTACDLYRMANHPHLSVYQILTALERIRYALTEGLLEHNETKH